MKNLIMAKITPIVLIVFFVLILGSLNACQITPTEQTTTPQEETQEETKAQYIDTDISIDDLVYRYGTTQQGSNYISDTEYTLTYLVASENVNSAISSITTDTNNNNQGGTVTI